MTSSAAHPSDGASRDAFPGATAVTRLRVYDWPAADGRCGGSPHLHTVSTEGYVVLGGTGVLETLSGDGYAEHPLRPGTLLWFTPGTVHRLVNTSMDLDILVVMQNAGLPEAGDAVLTFPPEVLADPQAYARAATLPTPGAGSTSEETGSALAAAARRRRDFAVEGYLALRDQVRRDGPAALAELYRAATVLVTPRLAGWRELWQRRALAAAERTGAQLASLGAGRIDHLAAARVHTGPATPGAAGFGMCGRLRTWQLHS